jgi:hypothetical protein
MNRKGCRQPELPSTLGSRISAIPCTEPLLVGNASSTNSPLSSGFARTNSPPVAESSRNLPRTEVVPSTRIATGTDPSSFSRGAGCEGFDCGKDVMTADYGSRTPTARDYLRALTERWPAHERMRTSHNMLDLCDATVGDSSWVIMASYEREPETQTKPRAHHISFLNVVAFTVCQPQQSTRDARIGSKAQTRKATD